MALRLEFTPRIFRDSHSCCNDKYSIRIRYDVHTAVEMLKVVFWGLKPCCRLLLTPKTGYTFLRHVGNHLQNYMEPHNRHRRRMFLYRDLVIQNIKTDRVTPCKVSCHKFVIYGLMSFCRGSQTVLFRSY
jgi:hypothetical protein